jgi:hypothetical protein
MQIRRMFGYAVLLLSIPSIGCKDSSASDKQSSDNEPTEHRSKHSTSKSAEAHSAPSASQQAVQAPAHAALDSLFDGAPPAGSKLSTLHLGVPNGWESGEFGEVKTASKDGYAAIYDLPVFPPVTST